MEVGRERERERESHKSPKFSDSPSGQSIHAIKKVTYDREAPNSEKTPYSSLAINWYQISTLLAVLRSRVIKE